MYRVITLRSLHGREITTVIEDGFGSITDALDFCDKHDPDSTDGYRAETTPPGAEPPCG